MENNKEQERIEMNESNYVLEPWMQYDMVDNGVYAPKGSNPKFHTENNCMRFDCNPIHPFVQGIVLHDHQAPDELIPKRRIMISQIKLTPPISITSKLKN